MSPNKLSSSSTSAFMAELLAGLDPVLPLHRRSNNQSSPPQRPSKNCVQTPVLSSSLKFNHPIHHPSPSQRTPKRTVGLVDSSSLPSNLGRSPFRGTSLSKDHPHDLFEGIDDWGDFSLENSQASPVRDEPTSVIDGYIKCRVEKLQDNPSWNPLKARMERQVEVRVESQAQSTRRTLVLCDEWIDLQLEIDNTLNIVSLPDSPPINLQLNPLVFSRAEPGHVLILFPSLLISATVVSNAPFCSRRSILGTRLKLSSNEVGEAVVRGNIVHETIQNSLLPNLEVDQNSLHIPTTPSLEESWKISRLSEEARRACIRRLSDLFMIGKTVDEGVKMASEHLENLPAWSSKYLIDRQKSKGEIFLNEDAVLMDPRSDVKSDSDRPRIGLTGVLDTEEEIWSPKYGLKGKIDVTVEALVIEKPTRESSKVLRFDPRNTTKNNTQIFPLEIKTGRQPSGVEHIAQTMLYTLLMSDRYNLDVTAGLLFYTSRHDLIRVRAVKDELRHLIMARNRLAHYMHCEPSNPLKAIQPTRNDIPDLEDLLPVTSFLESRILPEPIDNDRACCKCFDVEGCMLYRKAVEGVDSLPPRKGIEKLEELYQRKTRHLTPAHTDFFRRWEALISYEESEMGKLKTQIWSMSAQERERSGNAFANMIIDYSFNIQDNSYAFPPSSKIHQHTYCLRRAPDLMNQSNSDDLLPSLSLLSNMNKHDPIVISIEGKKLGLARGFILDLTAEKMIVGLDHRLEETDPLPLGTNLMVHLTQYAMTQSTSSHVSPTRYRIDKDELVAGMGKIRDNLAQLFLSNGNEKLRELIVDKRKPEFDLSRINQEELDKTLWNLSLNPEQVGVITKVLSAKDYSLVLGMPGTGKTTTIAELIKTLVRMGKTVLLTSYTHSAVDHILSKLIDSKIDMLRLGNVDKVSPALHRFTIGEFDPCNTVEELENKLMTPPLVATTSLSIHHPLFSRRKFDYCIVDEAAQVTLPTCLGPLRYAEVFVLVGDHYQLPPLVRNPKAKIGGLEISLFKLLNEAHPEAVVSLTIQYRMNEEIMSLSNALIYDGRLSSANQYVSNQTLEIPFEISFDSFHSMDPNPTSCIHRCWISDLLQPERNVIFANTDLLRGDESRIGNRLQNEAEAQLTVQLVHAFIRGGVKASDIGIITPYRQQIKLLRALVEECEGIEVMTADKSQGRDKECIVMMMVRKNSTEEVGELLSDWRRINVCLTRAKKKLIIFGSKSTLSHSQILGQFFKVLSLKPTRIYDLPPDSLELHHSLNLIDHHPLEHSSNPNLDPMTIAESRQPSIKSSLPFNQKNLNFGKGDTNLNDPSSNLNSSLDRDVPSTHGSKRDANHLSPSKSNPSKKLNSTLLHLPPRLSNNSSSVGILRDVMIDLFDQTPLPNR